MANFLTAAGATYAWQTDVGRVRARNEDSVAVDGALGLVVVADGMGGHSAGDVASRMAVEGVLTAMREGGAAASPQSRLVAAVRRANDAICAAADQDYERSGMGTTLVAVWLDGASLLAVHVGDSRLYRLRAGGLEPLTRDHTEVQGLVDRGILTPAQARVSARRNMLTRALGAYPGVDIDCATHGHAPGDTFLLCSDGLTNMLEDDEIAAVIRAAATLEAAADRLIELANERGGRDNITVALVRPG